MQSLQKKGMRPALTLATIMKAYISGGIPMMVAPGFLNIMAKIEKHRSLWEPYTRILATFP